MARIQLTRQQLYERAWATPIETLARELGLSGRGLGKLCARHEIPVPPRGYWARKAAGQSVPIPPLPPDQGPKSVKIEFAGLLSDTSEEPDGEPKVHPLIEAEQTPENAIVVPDDLPLNDPLVVKTQRLLSRAKCDAKGLCSVPPGGLHVHTSRAQHERALRVMQALLTALQARGLALSPGEEGSQVTVLEEPIAFGILEGIKMVEHPVTFSEQKLIDRGQGWQVPKHDYVPSGTLSLTILNVRHVRQRWTETPSRPLEHLLNRFLVAVIRAALGVKRQRADAERSARGRQEQERLRQDEARRLAEVELRWREEQARMDRLERLASLWNRHRQVRELVGALRTKAGDVEPGSELSEWLDWARDYVEASDPLRHLRARAGRTLTLYYYGYDWDSIERDGFREPGLHDYGSEKTTPGVELTCRPRRVTGYERALRVELAEDFILSYEWAQESDWYYREFRVPAARLNVSLRYSPRLR
ncbi:MAG: hypothetical protein Q8L86_19525 [Vicinamibacterales bacterium]|nr:hypothetical protein [Vicinamibacterales bacterium]